MGFPENTPRPSFNRSDKAGWFGVPPLGGIVVELIPPEGGTPNILVSPLIDSTDFHYAKIVHSQLGQFSRDGFAVGRLQMHCENIHSIMTKLAKFIVQHCRRQMLRCLGELAH